MKDSSLRVLLHDTARHQGQKRHMPPKLELAASEAQSSLVDLRRTKHSGVLDSIVAQHELSKMTVTVVWNIFHREGRAALETLEGLQALEPELQSRIPGDHEGVEALHRRAKVSGCLS